MSGRAASAARTSGLGLAPDPAIRGVFREGDGSMTIRTDAPILRLGAARRLTRAIAMGPFTELNPARHWTMPPE